MRRKTIGDGISSSPALSVESRGRQNNKENNRERSPTRGRSKSRGKSKSKRRTITAVSWISKLQKIVALSTTEAKYVTVTEAIAAFRNKLKARGIGTTVLVLRALAFKLKRAAYAMDAATRRRVVLLACLGFAAGGCYERDYSEPASYKTSFLSLPGPASQRHGQHANTCPQLNLAAPPRRSRSRQRRVQARMVQQLRPPVRFPFRLKDHHPDHCAYSPAFHLYCTQNRSDPFIDLLFPVNSSPLNTRIPFTIQASVKKIDYKSQTISISYLQSCLPPHDSILPQNTTASMFRLLLTDYNRAGSTLFNCSSDKEKTLSYAIWTSNGNVSTISMCLGRTLKLFFNMSKVQLSIIRVRNGSSNNSRNGAFHNHQGYAVGTLPLFISCLLLSRAFSRKGSRRVNP
ncbi:hypothetical protein RJ639_004726 [Escallonia herrerae]|uniref:RING-type E3 ubiquitin transferase n=1 Tax=Escallonia herrerae TaxID=1293975 RepID=A0AA88W3E6_9ASTE|nr:hypothetical protein RJ639_004726 [Escallonia herrerae]